MLDDKTAPRSLVLPPPYTAHWRPGAGAFEAACRLAPEGGAGSLVWHMATGNGQAGRLEFAVVLEPETPLAEARRAFIIAMVALGDALAAHCPPERAVTFGWPGEVLLDAGRIGGMRLGVAPLNPEDGVPDWLVLGVELIADRDHLATPGSQPDSVSLREEGFEDPPAVLESFAAYLMLHFDRWTHDGFAPVAARYGERLAPAGAISQAGDLLRDGAPEPLAGALRSAPWRDDTGPIL